LWLLKRTRHFCVLEERAMEKKTQKKAGTTQKPAARKAAARKKPDRFPWGLYAGKGKLNPFFGSALRIRCFEMGLWEDVVCEAACLSPGTFQSCRAGYLPGVAELTRLAAAVNLTVRELLRRPTIRYG